MKMVTAREFWHSSITNIRSFVVPNVSSRTMPALPNFSAVSSEKRGTIRPPVAIAMSWNMNKIKKLQGNPYLLVSVVYLVIRFGLDRFLMHVMTVWTTFQLKATRVNYSILSESGTTVNVRSRLKPHLLDIPFKKVNWWPTRLPEMGSHQGDHTCQSVWNVEPTSISGPPTHLTAGSFFWSKRWLASSSNPHWQMTRLAPVSKICHKMQINAPLLVTTIIRYKRVFSKQHMIKVKPDIPIKTSWQWLSELLHK